MAPNAISVTRQVASDQPRVANNPQRATATRITGQLSMASLIESVSSRNDFKFLAKVRLWSPMSPGTTNKEIKKSTVGDFCAPHCSSFFSCSCSCSCSYTKRPSIAIRPIGPQVPANLFDQRSASSQLKQPSSTSTVALSTVALSTVALSTVALSTSTTKSDARHFAIQRVTARKASKSYSGRSATSMQWFCSP